MKTELLYLFLFLLPILPLDAGAQYKFVRGTILDDASGSIISNVNIFDGISGVGTISDSKGLFSLMLKEKKPELTFTCEGFKSVTKLLDLANDTTIVIRLVPVIPEKPRTKSEVKKKLAQNDREK